MMTDGSVSIAVALFLFSIIFKLLLKLPPRKLEPWFVLRSFFLLRLALYLYKSTIQSCVKCCCHAWAGAPSCYLELLYNIQKQKCRTVGPSLAASLQLLAHWNVASLWLLSLFIGITLVDAHLNWLNRFHFLILGGGWLIILIDCMIFLSPFLDVTRMFMSTVFFLAQLCSGIPCH